MHYCRDDKQKETGSTPETFNLAKNKQTNNNENIPKNKQTCSCFKVPNLTHRETNACYKSTSTQA